MAIWYVDNYATPTTVGFVWDILDAHKACMHVMCILFFTSSKCFVLYDNRST